MRKTLVLLAVLAILSALVPSSAASPADDRGRRPDYPPGLQNRPANADLPVPDFSHRPDVPPAFGREGEGLQRYQDRTPEGLDQAAEARWARYAETVDQVLYELIQQSRTDFVVGIDAWGAPLFQAESDETADAILGVFPQGIRNQVEVVKAPKPTPILGISPPEQDRRLKDDGAWHYGGGIWGIASWDGGPTTKPYDGHELCTTGFTVKLNGSAYYLSIADHCVRQASQLGWVLDGIPTAAGSNVWSRSITSGNYNSSQLADRYLGWVKTHSYGTSYGHRCYKWIDLCLLASGSNENYDGYIWQSDPQTWAGSGELGDRDAWDVRKVVGDGTPWNGSQIAISTSRDGGTIAGIHVAADVVLHPDDCDTPLAYYVETGTPVPQVKPFATPPYEPDELNDCDFNGDGFLDGGWGFSYDTANQAGQPIYMNLKQTTSCTCDQIVGGTSGSPVYKEIGTLDSAWIVGHLILANVPNVGFFVPISTTLTNIEQDPRWWDAQVASYLEGGKSPSWP